MILLTTVLIVRLYLTVIYGGLKKQLPSMLLIVRLYLTVLYGTYRQTTDTSPTQPNSFYGKSSHTEPNITVIERFPTLWRIVHAHVRFRTLLDLRALSSPWFSLAEPRCYSETPFLFAGLSQLPLISVDRLHL